MRLDPGIDIGECAHGTGYGAGCDFFARGAQTAQVAIHLGIETGKGQAHGGGLGMDAVTAPDAHCVLVFDSAPLQRGQQPLHVRDQDVCGAGQLNVEGSVQNVGAGHALMHKAGFVAANNFGQVGQKGDHVMLGHGLDLINARNVEFRVPGFPDRFGIGLRDHAQFGHCVAGMRFDLEPDPELGLRAPDSDHVRAGIAGDHRGTFS